MTLVKLTRQFEVALSAYYDSETKRWIADQPFLQAGMHKMTGISFGKHAVYRIRSSAILGTDSITLGTWNIVLVGSHFLVFSDEEIEKIRE